MQEHFIILLLVLVVACIFIIEYFDVCVPVTRFTYDKVKDTPITKFCICPVADPMGADEYSRKIEE
jgi:hypothetical protein